jgi:hypothetical protein
MGLEKSKYGEAPFHNIRMAANNVAALPSMVVLFCCSFKGFNNFFHIF